MTFLLFIIIGLICFWAGWAVRDTLTVPDRLVLFTDTGERIVCDVSDYYQDGMYYREAIHQNRRELIAAGSTRAAAHRVFLQKCNDRGGVVLFGKFK